MRFLLRIVLAVACLSSTTALAAPCDFSYNYSGVQVWGLASSSSGNPSPAACEAACCVLGAAACDIWQWCPGGACSAGAGGAGCWVGTLQPHSERKPVSGWVSMSSVAPPPPASDKTINAAAPPSAPVPIAGLAPTTNVKTGATLSIDSASLLLDAKRILPFAGEMHFSRTPRASWAQDLAAMKAGGLDVVQAYVFWLHTEEVQGQQDWTDNRALGEFVDEAQRAGLLVALRIGPWCHGEARNGGWPDWVGAQPGVRVRTNTTAWLNLVRGWYAGVSAQIKGKFFADGGPIISVQLDNETPDVDYLLALRKLALNVGITPWLFIKTGWPSPNAAVEPGVLLPVSGGYFSEFWESDAHNDTGGFLFGAVDSGSIPIVTAESGPGMASSYHRRIHIVPDYATAAIQTFLAQSVSQLGMYSALGGRSS